jgi:hypothetical protein
VQLEDHSARPAKEGLRHAVTVDKRRYGPGVERGVAHADRAPAQTSALEHQGVAGVAVGPQAVGEAGQRRKQDRGGEEGGLAAAVAVQLRQEGLGAGGEMGSR